MIVQGNFAARCEEERDGALPCEHQISSKVEPMDLAQYRARVIDSYALVAYIPNPLGEFLDSLSRTLVPGCHIHSHVTLLPPRHLKGTIDEAMDVLDAGTRTICPFELQITDIQIFDVTSVLYANVGHGRARLIDVYRHMNTGVLQHDEQFPYHPHVTLAIDTAHADIHALAAEARQLWKDYPHSRRFVVETLTFVHNVGMKQWEEVSVYDLVGAAHSHNER